MASDYRRSGFFYRSVFLAATHSALLMSAHSPQIPRHSREDALRLAIAALAARLMAEDGINDFALAKRKAVRQLGLRADAPLPDNQQVAAALREYQTLYQGDELPERLLLLRSEALALMRRLETFNPCLTGPVLDGTAGRYAEAEIDLFVDSGKDVEIFLLNSGIIFEQVGIRQRGPEAPELRLRVEGAQTNQILNVYPQVCARQRRRNLHRSQVAGRAGIAALAALLGQT